MLHAIGKAYVAAQEEDEKNLRRASQLQRETIRTSHQVGLESRSRSQISKKSQLTLVSSVENQEDNVGDVIENHEKWESQYMLLAHMLASAFDGSNIWRSGYLFYHHGGSAFLIPYTFFTLVIALPSVYLELIIGQYAQVGAIAAFKFVPVLKGIGFCMILVAVVDTFKLHAIMAWCSFYVLQSIAREKLPWISCDNGYGKLPNGQKDPSIQVWDPKSLDHEKNWHTEQCVNFYEDTVPQSDGTITNHQRLPGAEYFRGRVIGQWTNGHLDHSKDYFKGINGVDTFGLEASNTMEFWPAALSWEMALYLLFAFGVVQIFLYRGIKMSVNALLAINAFLVVGLVLLFFRGTGLQGAWNGLSELFKPKFEKLLHWRTWTISAQQVIYSSSTGMGVHLCLASHDNFNRKIVFDALITVFFDYTMCVLAAGTIFLYLGHVKYVTGRDLATFVSSGPQMVFEVMSDVLGVLAKRKFYALTFYALIFCLSLTTVVTTLLTAKISFLEILPASIKYSSGRRLFLGLIFLVITYCLSYLNLTRAGLHIFGFQDTFAGSLTVIGCTFLFQVGIAWIYGLKNVVAATKEMNIRIPGIYFQICWRYISPIALAFVFVCICIDPDSYRVEFDNHTVDIGYWVILGYIISFSPFVIILIVAIVTIWRSPGNTFKKKLLTSISPTSEHEDIQWTGYGHRSKCSHWCYLYAKTGYKCNIFCAGRARQRRVAPQNTLSGARRNASNVSIFVQDAGAEAERQNQDPIPESDYFRSPRVSDDIDPEDTAKEGTLSDLEE